MNKCGWLIGFLTVIGVAASASAAENLLDCQAETTFNIDKGQRPSDTRYIFSYDAEKLELVKLQEGGRPIAIRVNYDCREDALQVYCERFDYGTYWTLQLTKADLSFLETIGEYQGQTINPPLSSLKGKCSRRARDDNLIYQDDDEIKKAQTMTREEIAKKYGVEDYDPNWREKQRVEKESFESTTSELWKSVFASQKACREGNPTLVWQACWERALPKKCGSLVYQARTPSAEHLQSWIACALSCVDSGFWDRHFGDCARDYIAN